MPKQLDKCFFYSAPNGQFSLNVARWLTTISLNIQISVIKIDFNISHTRVVAGCISFFFWGGCRASSFMNEAHKKTPACDVLWMKPFFSLQTKQKISREATRANRQRNNQQIFHNRRCRCLRVFFLHGQSQLELNKKKAFLKIHFQNYRLEPCHYSKIIKNWF